MANNNQVLGWIILAGLAIMVIIALLQVLTLIFFILTIFSIIATITFVIFGFMEKDEWTDNSYFLYAGVAILCVFLFFMLGRATFSTAEALQNNDLTKGLMEITSAFFLIQEEKQKAIEQLEDAQMQVINNLTNELTNQIKTQP
jgi:uncharacterized membrane protein